MKIKQYKKSLSNPIKYHLIASAITRTVTTNENNDHKKTQRGYLFSNINNFVDFAGNSNPKDVTK